MANLSRLLPHSPFSGPPVPQIMPGWPRPKVRKQQDAERTQEDSTTKSPTGHEDDYTFVLRKKSQRPAWLAKYQERMKQASAKAAAETSHLKGPERVKAMNRLVAQYMKENNGHP